MNILTSAERNYLRSQAHHLDPVILIGKQGVTEGTIDAINRLLDARELIKIKFHNFKNEKLTLSEKITSLTHSEVVGIIGNIVIIFRQNPDLDKRQIKLP